jgi:hypothetical protein
MKRRNREQEPAVNVEATGIPPWIDQFGRPVWNNPWNQYRPNTQGLPAAPVAAAPVAPVAPAVPVPAQPLPAPVSRYAAAPPLELPAPTHLVTDDRKIEADDDRIRATIQYAKGYAKACRELGLAIPAEIQARLRDDLSVRRNRVHKRVRRTVATAAALSAGAVGMTAAAAYFTSPGSGSGAATVSTITVNVSATAGTPSAPLYPGSTGDVTLKVDNPNDFAVTLKKVEGNGAITASGGKGSCGAADISFTDQTSLSTTLPANSTGNPIDLLGAASMPLTAADGCQGATFTIPVKVTVQEP